MDFPVCPSCHQSVIDDDAVDCPFCGAPMKGKPGSKPAPAAAKPAAATAGKPAVAKGGKTAGAKPTLPGDDFPFEAELTAGKPAIPAMPNPTKQRTLQVVCPMCDTQGYVPPNAVGQDVRCANPKCVMPVFTLPLPKKVEEAPPPPPPKKSNLPLVGGVTFAVMALIGVGLYMFNSIPQGGGNPAQKGLSEEDKAELMSQSKPPAKTAVQQKKGVGKEKATDNGEKKTTAEQPTGDDLVATVLKQMPEFCHETTKQRSKPYCRQMAAEANAITGNADAAREHLVQLLRVGSSVSYYRITPLLDLFWFDLAKDPNQAAKSLNLAMTEVPQLPKSSASRLELTGQLATALIAVDRMPEALKLMEDYHSSDADSQLEARLLMASEGKVGPVSTWYSVLPWKNPGSVAVTGCLISRGYLDRAEKWAATQTSDDGKTECLAIWSEEIAQRKVAEGAADVDGLIEGHVKTLSPALAARVWARVACGRFRAKDPGGTAVAMKSAAELLRSIPVPAESMMPVFKETERFKLPVAAPLIQAATAAAELAFVQSYAGAKPDAEKSLNLALSFMDGTAPTFAAAEQRLNEMNKMAPSRLRDELRNQINKRMNDDQAHRAANNYKNALIEIVAASRQRFETETLILSRVRSAGLDSKVWIVVNARSTADDINHRDDFFNTDLPGELVEGLKGTPEERAILGAWQARSKGEAPPRPVAVEFHDNLKTDTHAAATALQRLPVDSNLRKEIPLVAVTRLANDNQLSAAFQSIMALPDVVLREDCYRLVAAIASQRKQADAVWKQVSTVQQPTEKAALSRGLIGGLKSVDQPTESLPQ